MDKLNNFQYIWSQWIEPLVSDLYAQLDNEFKQEWYDSVKGEYGVREADTMRSRLCVAKSMRKYNNLNRIMPGAIFLYNGKRYVLRGQLTGGKYYRAEGTDNINFPAKDCTVVCRNAGLVFA